MAPRSICRDCKSCIPLNLGDHIAVADTCILGVLITSDMSLDNHVSAVRGKCFFQLQQLQQTRHSLDDKTVTTSVLAIITKRINYCNCLLTTTDKLQSVTNAAAQVITNTRKSPTNIPCHELHRLDVTDCIKYQLCINVYKST